MGKMYTLDKKLLCGSPEIRIGEKVYPVDDRKSNVMKIMQLYKKSRDESADGMESTEKALELAFGKGYKEIESLDLPFAAYQELIELVIAALTGEEPADYEERRKQEKEQRFREDAAK